MSKYLSRRAFGSSILGTSLAALSSGCGGGGGSAGSGSPAVGGGGTARGSVNIEVPFATSQLSRVGKYAPYPSTVDHVEIQLFSSAVTGTVQVASRDNPVVSFPNVPVGQNWMLAVAMRSSNLFFPPPSSHAQRALYTPTVNDVFSAACVEVNVHEGDNAVRTNTIGGALSSIIQIGIPITVNNMTGLQLTRSEPGQTERSLVTADETNGVQFIGNLNNAATQFTSDFTPPASIFPLPASPGTRVTQQLVQRVGTVMANVTRDVGYVSTDVLNTPMGIGNTLHQRIVDTTIVGSGGVLKLQDLWIMRGIGPVLIVTRFVAVGVAPDAGDTPSFSRALRSGTLRPQTSGTLTPTPAEFADADLVEIMIGRSAGSPLSGALGTDLGVGIGTVWQYLAVDR